MNAANAANRQSSASKQNGRVFPRRNTRLTYPLPASCYIPTSNGLWGRAPWDKPAILRALQAGGWFQFTGRSYNFANTADANFAVQAQMFFDEIRQTKEKNA